MQNVFSSDCFVINGFVRLYRLDHLYRAFIFDSDHVVYFFALVKKDYLVVSQLKREHEQGYAVF